MSKPFDAGLKDLGAGFPRDFLCTFDAPPTGTVRSLNVDLSTITTAADLVLGIGDPLEEIIHIDFQSQAMASKHRDVLAYNSLLFRHYDVPVHSIIVLLRPQARHSKLNGAVNYAPRARRGSMSFSYEIVPMWERLAEEVLAGALGTLPLAVLGRLPEGVDLIEGIRGIVGRIVQRLAAEVTAEQRLHLLTASLVLTGLRLSLGEARQIFAGVQGMEESSTYMGIIDEGREREAKRVIRIQAEDLFGAPEESIITRLEGITDLDHLERLCKRVLRAKSWQDLLDTP
jgi:hypothetical protein